MLFLTSAVAAVLEPTLAADSCIQCADPVILIEHSKTSRCLFCFIETH